METTSIKPGLFTRNQPPNGWIIKTIVVIAASVYALALFGEVLLSQLVDNRPEALVALNPTNKNLALVNGDKYKIEALPYYAIGFSRLLLTDPLYYLIGFWYGDRALKWLKKKSKSMKTIFEESEKFIKNMSYVMVFISPASYICVLAAAIGMKFRTFLAINIAGTVFSLVTIRLLGNQFGGGIDTVVDFITKYRWQVFAVSIVFVGYTLYRDLGSDKSDLAILKDVDSAGEESDS